MVGARVTVGNTPTAIAGPFRAAAMVYVTNGATAIDLGSDAVATGAGYPLAISGSLPFPILLAPGDVLYGITAAGSSAVAVLSGPRGD